MQLEAFVFSFNRGPHLRNCLDTIKAYAPDLKVTIVDDGSTDPETLAVLDAVDATVSQPMRNNQERLGGLYSNMQWALDNCSADLALFLQDDVQLVRPIDEKDWGAISDFFDADIANVFINPSFRMGPRSLRRRVNHHPWPPYAGYSFDNSRSDQSSDTRRWFFAVSLLHAGRLKQTGWRFARTESENARQSAAKFAPMLHLAAPFVSQLPEVSTLRYGKRSLGAAWAEHLSGHAVNRFRPMSAEHIEKLHTLPLHTIPLAEEWIYPENPNVRSPYIHKGVNARWFTRLLNNLEVRIKRLLKS